MKESFLFRFYCDGIIIISYERSLFSFNTTVFCYELLTVTKKNLMYHVAGINNNNITMVNTTLKELKLCRVMRGIFTNR